jgi:hypothetical protein
MSNGIPKSARDVLAKQTAADVHLSPDLLNAYVEHSLTEAEKEQVTVHLASCADCREVVFLASAAGEEELESALVAAATPRVLQPAAVAQQAQQPPGCAVLEPRQKRPILWWKWALPLTAVVIVGAAVLVERDRFSGMMSSPPADMAAAKMSSPQSAASESPATVPNPTASPTTPGDNRASSGASDVFLGQPTVASRARQQAANKIDLAEQAQKAKPARGQSEQLALQAAPASKVENFHSNAPSETMAAAPMAAAKPAAPPAPSTSQSVEVTSAAPLVQADNADTGADAARDLKAQSMAKSLTADQLGALTTLEMERSPAPAKTRWRISRDGHVEHTVGPSTWERVMAAEPVTFRVVATVGNNVWAGGSDGALFHSSDTGKHWDRVALAGEQGAITSIHFSTAQQGSLTSDSGATWTTTDGGQTWSKQ